MHDVGRTATPAPRRSALAVLGGLGGLALVLVLHDIAKFALFMARQRVDWAVPAQRWLGWAAEHAAFTLPIAATLFAWPVIAALRWAARRGRPVSLAFVAGVCVAHTLLAGYTFTVARIDPLLGSTLHAGSLQVWLSFAVPPLAWLLAAWAAWAGRWWGLVLVVLPLAWTVFTAVLLGAATHDVAPWWPPVSSAALHTLLIGVVGRRAWQVRPGAPA